MEPRYKVATRREGVLSTLKSPTSVQQPPGRDRISAIP
jgi:hypothetical protein